MLTLFDFNKEDRNESLESSVSTDIDLISTTEDIVTLENDINTNLSILDNSLSAISSLEERYIVNEDALKNDTAIESSLVASQEALDRAQYLLIGNKVESLSIESFFSPKENLTVSQETIGSFIETVLSKVTILFEKILIFFRKMFSKISAWVTSFTPRLSKLSKFYKTAEAINSEKLQAIIDNKSSEYRIMQDVLIKYPDLLLDRRGYNRSLSKLIVEGCEGLNKMFSDGRAFVRKTSDDYGRAFQGLSKNGELNNAKMTRPYAKSAIYDKNEILGDKEYGYDSSTIRDENTGIFKYSEFKKLVEDLIDQELAYARGALKKGEQTLISPYIKKLDYNENSQTVTVVIGDAVNAGKEETEEIKLSSSLEELTEKFIKGIDKEGPFMSRAVDEIISCYKKYPAFVNDAIKAYETSMASIKRDVEASKRVVDKQEAKSGDNKMTPEEERLMSVRSRYIADIIDIYKINMAICRHVKRYLGKLSQIAYNVKPFYTTSK